MNVEAFGVRGQLRRKLGQFLGRKTCFNFELRLVQPAEIAVPVFGQVTHRGLGLRTLGLLLRFFELGFDGIGLRLSIGCADVVGVDFPQRRVVFDLLVEQRLRDGWIVYFAMAMAAIANEINDDVGTELVAIFSREARDADNCVNVFCIDVEDGNRLPPRDAGGESRRMLLGVARGKSQQIIDDDVNRAADRVSSRSAKFMVSARIPCPANAASP